MSEAAPPRRWFQFRIGTIFWLMLVVALATLAIKE
jgi:hypothetical protein